MDIGRADGFTLFRDIETVGAIGIIVSAPEELSQHRVVPLMWLAWSLELTGRELNCSRLLHSLWLDMPSREIVLKHPDKSLLRVITTLSSGNDVYRYVKGMDEHKLARR